MQIGFRRLLTGSRISLHPFGSRLQSTRALPARRPRWQLPRVAATPEEAVERIRPGSNIFVHTGAATPTILVEALAKMTEHHTAKNYTGRANQLYHCHTYGSLFLQRDQEAAGDKKEEEKERADWQSTALFCGSNDRKFINKTGRFIPVFLSEIESLWRTGRIDLDAALLQVSPPDRHGYCSLGTSIDVSLSALEYAAHVVALVNPQMPRTHGQGIVHISQLDAIHHVDCPIYFHPASETPSPVEQAVGKNVAKLIPNGANLQMGIGAIPDAVLACLDKHRDLGIHSEMFSDGIVRLVEKGVITGACKNSEPHQIAGSFCIGSKKLYDLIDDNPFFNMMRTSYINSHNVVASQPRMMAINSCLEIDLTGQICADSIGEQIYSGVGGQMDFMRGAALSEGGKPIMALTSRTPKGIPRIVPFLKHGAGVVTTRSHAQFIVTEYGSCDLHGLDLYERAEALIELAHPDDRPQLSQFLRQRFPARMR